MRGDCNKVGTTRGGCEAHLNCAVHRELRRLIPTERESASCWRCSERDNRYVDQGAIVAEDRREVNEAYCSNRDRRSR